MNPPAVETLSLETVQFRAGGCRFAIEAEKVRALDPVWRAQSRCPRVETLLGLDAVSQAQVRILHLRRADRTVAVAGDVELNRLAAHCIHPLPPLLSARMRINGVRALGLDARGPILIVDPDLLESPESGTNGTDT
jgi:hypothetical protein